MNRLLIIEDDAEVAHALVRTLQRAGYVPVAARSLADGRAELARAVYDVVLLDLGLPDGDGLAALDFVHAAEPHVRVVVVSGRNEVALAVSAVQKGAADYVVKPWDRETLLRAIERAKVESRLRREIEAARLQAGRGATRAVGSSAAWVAAMNDLRDAAASPRAPVLICGESGTGKDIAASLVHEMSPRAAGPFVTLNAACLPTSMIESELFGHEPGAFTGARTARRGLFELAAGGTLFLDEIGELPIDLQPKLLRVLEGHPFRRLGGEREVRAHVRLVAATNRSLPEMIAQGRFREDLFYRLKVMEVHLPALRDRRGDVRELTFAFLGRLAREAGASEARIEPAALECLERYEWPGNVRELRNVIERAVLVSRGGPVTCAHLPVEIRAETFASARAQTEPSSAAVHAPRGSTPEVLGSLDDAVRRHVLAAYEQHAGNVSRTAAALQITRVALRRKLREFGAYNAPAPARTARASGQRTRDER